MPQYISTNITSLQAQNNLDKSSSALAKSLERLSSGQRINSASDDAAGMAIASRMTAQIRGMDAAKRNTQDGISMVQTSEGAMGVQVEQLQRTRELSVQASNGMLSFEDRTKLNTEAVALMDELNKIATETNFNGNKLLDGSIASMIVQVGANATETRDITFVDTTAATLLVAGESFATEALSSAAGTTAGSINLQNVTNASEAITTIDAALDAVQSGRSNMGAYQNRLEQTISNLDVSINNVSASRGRIQDADFAKETADMTKNQILAQAGVAMLSQANQLPQNVLSLIR
jgi:flagellin